MQIRKNFTELENGLKSLWAEISEIIADEETLRLKGNDNLAYATQQLDNVNKLGLRRSGYRADHENIKKKVSIFKNEFFKVLNLERDCQQQLEIAIQLEIHKTAEAMRRALEILKDGKLNDDLFVTVDEVLAIQQEQPNLNEQLSQLQHYQSIVTQVISQREEAQKEITKSIFKLEELEQHGVTEELKKAKADLEFRQQEYHSIRTAVPNSQPDLLELSQTLEQLEEESLLLASIVNKIQPIASRIMSLKPRAKTPPKVKSPPKPKKKP